MMTFDPEAYTIIIRKEELDGEVLYVGRVAEFPNISSYESDFESARKLVLEAIESLKKIADEKHIEFPLPNPTPEAEYNGRVTLRLPKTLHAKVARLADQENVSLNSYLVTAIASYAGAQDGIGRVVSNAFNVFRAAAKMALTETWTSQGAVISQQGRIVERAVITGMEGLKVEYTRPGVLNG